MKKVHIHTDCRLFEGCENMVISLLNDKKLNDFFSFSFSYRYTKEYVAVLERRLLNKNIQIYPLNLRYHKPFLNKLERLLTIFINPVLVLWDIVLLFRIFREVSPDIVYINNGGYPGARSCRSAVLAARIAGVKKILFYVNNIAVPYNSLTRFLDLSLDYFVKKNTTYFITASRFARDELHKVLKINKQQILHIYNTFQKKPITESRKETRKKLGISDGQIVVGSIGLLEERKGYNYLIKAVFLLRSKFNHNNFKTIIVGYGPEKESLEKIIRDCKLSGTIRILPYQEDIFNYYNSFDIFVLPSVAYDDLPFVIREAMNMGLPIVSTRFAGIPEIVEDGKNGFLVGRRNSDELACSLNKLIQNEELRRRFGHESRKIYNAKLSHNNIMRSYKELFDKI